MGSVRPKSNIQTSEPRFFFNVFKAYIYLPVIPFYNPFNISTNDFPQNRLLEDNIVTVQFWKIIGPSEVRATRGAT